MQWHVAPGYQQIARYPGSIGELVLKLGSAPLECDMTTTCCAISSIEILLAKTTTWRAKSTNASIDLLGIAETKRTNKREGESISAGDEKPRASQRTPFGCTVVSTLRKYTRLEAVLNVTKYKLEALLYGVLK